MEKKKKSVPSEYSIELRDINGQRTHRSFRDRNEFYRWAVDQNRSANTDELEILIITRAIPPGVLSSQHILYSSLWHERLSWDELVGYLA